MGYFLYISRLPYIDKYKIALQNAPSHITVRSRLSGCLPANECSKFMFFKPFLFPYICCHVHQVILWQHFPSVLRTNTYINPYTCLTYNAIICIDVYVSSYHNSRNTTLGLISPSATFNTRITIQASPFSWVVTYVLVGRYIIVKKVIAWLF